MMRTDTCDAYRLGMERNCPGIELHCTAGEHCNYTDASCAAMENVNDHPGRCCVCKTGYGPLFDAQLAKGNKPHEFEAFEGSSGFACVALFMDGDDPEECGLGGQHPIHYPGEGVKVA